MRFMVIVHRGVEAAEVMGPEEAEGEGIGPEDVVVTEVARVVLCEDSRAVAVAIRECDSAKREEWAGVFEVVGGKALPRAVVHKWDGKCLYDVEIS